jgi:[protein-PII] uridylyltransferase
MDLTGLRAELRDRRAGLADRFRATRDVGALLRGQVRLADRMLLALWRDIGLGADGCLAAVGGYGRGELMPHSDIDLLLLVAAEPDAAVSARIERFVGACWDLGLEISHSVRTIEQSLTESAADITVQTSLLERRFLAGRRSLYAGLGRSLDAATDPRDFFHAKLFELRQRHAKFDDTPYSLEPNVKESPGGLRDLQSIKWIARAAGLGARWPDLAPHGLVSPAEARLLAGVERKHKVVRAWLHLIAGRREDRLVFDLQAQVGRALGLGAGDARRSGSVERDELVEAPSWHRVEAETGRRS